MSDNDDQPQQPKNPFIRFKNHVNTRIGTGISVLTGGNLARERDEAPTRPSSEDPYARHSESERIGPSCANRNMHPFDRARRRREPTEGFQYWDRWSQLDPYSPYNLRHLPQPIPNDLPRDVDASHFGFHEAFEDLMAVSGIDDGRLMDLRGRADLKKSILKKFASGEPSLVWVTRLHRNGLLPPPFIWEYPTFLGEIRERSGQAAEQEQHRPASILDWLDERRKTTESQEEAERRCAEDIEALKGLTTKIFQDLEGKGLSWDEMKEKLDKEFVINPAGMIRKAEQAFHDFEKEVERYANELTGANTRTSDEAKVSPGDNQGEPSTEQDLFSMIRSAVAEADKSFNTFAKSITDMASPYTDWQGGKGRQEKSPGSETVECDSNGGKTITTTSEHTDMFGNIHSKTEVRSLNADGEEVGLQTHYSVHSSHSTGSQRAGGEDYDSHVKLLEQQNKERLRMAREEEHKAWPEHTEKSAKKEDFDSGDKNGKSSGWFWR